MMHRRLLARSGQGWLKTRCLSPWRVFFLAVLILLAVGWPDNPAQAETEEIASDSATASRAVQAPYVILISVDGLRPDAVTALGPEQAPHFYRFRTEGVWTDNARTDFDYTITLPNHTTQLTGRRVTIAAGHNWTSNSDPAPSETIHSKKRAYVASVFDVAHDGGLRTGAYASKSKFILFDRSYDAAHGAPDITGSDESTDKIDAYRFDADTNSLVAAFISAMQADPFHFSVLHLRDPDTAGHADGWDSTPGSPYSNAIKAIDALLGDLFTLVENDPGLVDNTVIIVTSDHGGTGTGHNSPAVREHYTIPFYVWGAGVAAGADLYTLNATTRQDPDAGRPDYSASPQPIRNGDAANLALMLLGLPNVPGSTINTTEALAVDGSDTTVSRVADEALPSLSGLAIESIYPHPFNAHTTMRLALVERGTYQVQIYNALGQQVYQTDLEAPSPGRYGVTLSLAPFSSGVYLVHVRHRPSGAAVTAKMMVVK